MHELAVTKSILNLALDQTARNGGTEILSIHLVIGELRNLEENWIQRYFDYIARGTLAQGATIKVTKTPVLFACQSCGGSFSPDLRIDQRVVCPHCGSFEYDLVSGRELTLEKIEVR